MSITLGSTDDLLVPFSDSVDVADLHKKQPFIYMYPALCSKNSDREDKGNSENGS
jgi:hypothetical protein